MIGYGLDFAERYRNLPYVAVLHPDLIPPHYQDYASSGQCVTGGVRGNEAATLP